MASGAEHDKVAAGVGFRSQTGGREGVASLFVVFFPVSQPHRQRKRVVEDVDDVSQSRMQCFKFKLDLLQSLAGSNKVFSRPHVYSIFFFLFLCRLVINLMLLNLVSCLLLFPAVAVDLSLALGGTAGGTGGGEDMAALLVIKPVCHIFKTCFTLFIMQETDSGVSSASEVMDGGAGGGDDSFESAAVGFEEEEDDFEEFEDEGGGGGGGSGRGKSKYVTKHCKKNKEVLIKLCLMSF